MYRPGEDAIKEQLRDIADHILDGLGDCELCGDRAIRVADHEPPCHVFKAITKSHGTVIITIVHVD